MLSQRLHRFAGVLERQGLRNFAAEASSMAEEARRLEAGAPPRAGLTARQAQCLGVIERLTDGAGVAPSYREIARELGIASVGETFRLVGTLIERGHLRRLPRRARALAVVTDRKEPTHAER